MQRRGAVLQFVALSKASLIGAIVTGRVRGALPQAGADGADRLRCYRTSADVNIELAAERPRAVRASAPAIGLLITDFRVVATRMAAVVHHRDGRPQVLIRCTACRHASGLGPYAAGNVRGGRLTTRARRRAGRPGGAEHRRPRRLRACVPRLGRARHALGPHMMWGNALPSPRRVASAPDVGGGNRRRCRRAGRSRRFRPVPLPCTGRPQSCSVVAHAAPATPRWPRPHHADSEFSLRARAPYSRGGGGDRAGLAPAAPGLGGALRSKRDAPGRPSASRAGGHEDDDDDQCGRRTSVLHSPTTDLDALRPDRSAGRSRAEACLPCEPSRARSVCRWSPDSIVSA